MFLQLQSHYFTEWGIGEGTDAPAGTLAPTVRHRDVRVLVVDGATPRPLGLEEGAAHVDALDVEGLDEARELLPRETVHDPLHRGVLVDGERAAGLHQLTEDVHGDGAGPLLTV